MNILNFHIMIKRLLPLSIAAFFFVAIVSCNQNQTSEKSTEQLPKEFNMNIKKERFGLVNDSIQVYLFTLKNKNGVEIRITNYGGIVTAIIVPDKNGEFDDIALGFNNLESYIAGHPYFGAIVGRCANRIAEGKFTLNGKTYQLAANNGPNHLHGGIEGFDKKVWEADDAAGPDSVSVILTYHSPDGEEGYPGNLDTRVIYTLNNDNELIINYEARTDQSTPINVTHHSYFNLAGEGKGDIYSHLLTIDADRYTVVNENLIPTGELRPVDNTPMDFREAHTIGERINLVKGGYDHNYVLNNNGKMARVAVVEEPKSGRIMEVFTSEPGMQFYSGNFLDGSIVGKSSYKYYQRYGFCLETQHFPDSPNQPSFPSAILNPGEVYSYTTIYKFSVK